MTFFQISKIENKPLVLWLFGCAALVFMMVVVGAITRLTESGLSMVEWRPLIDAIPPLNQEDWERVFALYKATPEFQKKNFWMEIEDFKKIFFWEWFHRLWGKVIGLAFGLPLLWFWIKNQIPKGYKLKLFGLLVLGGLQGFMGWYMVKSGLVDEPAVSHYRLAAHLSLAFLIFSLLIWVGLSLSKINLPRPHPVLYAHGWIVLCVLIITIFWGAYTAGLDAGLVYNETFPKMGAYWVPPEVLSHKPHLPAWINLFEDPVGVQFMHRWLAVFTVLMIFGFWLHAQKRGHIFPAIHALMIMALFQMGLGITTLLSGVALPIAVLHQAGALILLLCLVACLHTLKEKR